MELELERDGIKLIPETEQDLAYIEDTLGMAEHGDAVCLMREDVGPVGSAYVCLRARRCREEDQH